MTFAKKCQVWAPNILNLGLAFISTRILSGIWNHYSYFWPYFTPMVVVTIISWVTFAVLSVMKMTKIGEEGREEYLEVPCKECNSMKRQVEALNTKNNELKDAIINLKV